MIIEDNERLAQSLQDLLKQIWFDADICTDGITGACQMETGAYDLVILDLMLPGKDGFSVLSEARSRGVQTPVLLLTARSEVEDKVRGLEGGADYYLTKPFEIIELLARVETVLRRCHKTEQFLTEGDLVIDTASRTVKKNGTMVNLTNKEYELLLLFVRNKNIALYRETIYERIWGGEYTGDSRTVDLHVQRMRRKVGWEDKIVTVYKVGYRLEG